jgi:hypothetical protein
MFKPLIQFTIVLGVFMSLTACSNTFSWDEEVKLLDGRVITVQQKRRFDDSRMPREAWLSFRLPEFGDKEILWHEGLATMVLNVYKQKLYVVGFTTTVVEFRLYGQPQPPYIGFRYDNDKWVRIPFNEIPEAIYNANMWSENMSLYKLKFVSIEDKNSKVLEADGYPKELVRIDPHNKF